MKYKNIINAVRILILILLVANCVIFIFTDIRIPGLTLLGISINNLLIYWENKKSRFDTKIIKILFVLSIICLILGVVEIIGGIF